MNLSFAELDLLLNLSRKILRLGPPSYSLLGLTVFINTVEHAMLSAIHTFLNL